MNVTDEMVDDDCQSWLMQSTDTTIGHAMKAALEAALSTIKPMTAREIDNVLERGCIDDTVDLVEAVEYWHGIRGVIK